MRYVAVGDADVAYQVIGEGASDLVYFHGLGSQVDSLWDDPWTARLLDGLALFSRIIVFDRRGTGASDRVPRDAIPTWEEWTQDLGAVLDDVGSERAALVSGVDAGPIAVLFAAMRPERVDALVLTNTTARYLVDDDYPIGASSATVDALVDAVRTLWGKPRFIELVQPANADDTEFVRRNARRLRATATPATAAAQLRYILASLDVRGVLPSVCAPTLVLHTSHNPFIPVEQGRYLANHIVGARFVEVSGRGVGFDDDKVTVVLEEITEFLTGERPVAQVDRVLTTVLFTDIVSSTEQLMAKGDLAWRRLLDQHDNATSRIVTEFHGQLIKSTGDGILATFDGPARAVRCATALLASARENGIHLRAGLHTGEIELRPKDIAGIAVHIASRIANLAGPSEILVSRTVVDLTAGSGLRFEPRGEHQLKGIPDTWPTFAAQPTT